MVELQVAGCWLLVVGCWLSVAGCQSGKEVGDGARVDGVGGKGEGGAEAVVDGLGC